MFSVPLQKLPRLVLTLWSYFAKLMHCFDVLAALSVTLANTDFLLGNNFDAKFFAFLLPSEWQLWRWIRQNETMIVTSVTLIKVSVVSTYGSERYEMKIAVLVLACVVL